MQGLYPIIDNTFCPHISHVRLAEQYLLGGATTLQLRIKKAATFWDPDVFEIAKKIVALKKWRPFTFIVNDYIDVAAEIRADGVHVGANDLPISEVQKRIGNSFLIGYSAHSLTEATQAAKEGAGYVALGAIFPTRTKGPGHPIQGLKILRQVVQDVSVPVVAIGGIDRANVQSVLDTGCAAFAMITGLCLAKDIVQETKWFVEQAHG